MLSKDEKDYLWILIYIIVIAAIVVAFAKLNVCGDLANAGR